ncbi:MAG: Fe-S cluster assembly protein IscX [Phycisphaerales bacterium]|nr:MAG: Fe-S cluster assembly protein IscX [Phycisphaerales bacterium]
MGVSSFGWLDVRRIAEELADRHADIDPLTVSFPRLREMVAGLPGFVADPKHNVNERILEEIQRLWIEERE